MLVVIEYCLFFLVSNNMIFFVLLVLNIRFVYLVPFIFLKSDNMIFYSYIYSNIYFNNWIINGVFTLI